MPLKRLLVLGAALLCGAVAQAQSTNDSCANALPVQDGVSVTFTTTGNSVDGADPGCGGQAPVDVWFSYLANCTGQVTFSLCGSSYDTRVAVFQGGGSCPPDPLTQLLGCNDDYCLLESQVTVPLLSGQQVLIQVGGYETLTGAGTLVVNCGGPLVNDECVDAIPVVNGMNPLDTTDATGFEPAVDSAACDGWIASNEFIYSDVWFVYTAPVTATIGVDTCGMIPFDSRMAVYPGGVGACGGLAPGSEIACNDDSLGCPSFESRLSFDAVMGETYLIRVGGFTVYESGSGTLEITEPGPPGDSCDSALTLVFGQTMGTLIGATNGGSASCGNSGGSPDAWYTFTAASDCFLSVDACLSSFDTVLSLHDGCPGLEILCDDDGSCGLTSLAELNMLAGQTVLVRIASWNATPGGEYVLDVSCGAPATGGESRVENFVRGDANGDGVCDISDAVFLLTSLFPGPDQPLAAYMCSDAVDTNDDGSINVADGITILFSLFGSFAGPLPGPNMCGTDPTTADGLSCNSYKGCP